MKLYSRNLRSIFLDITKPGCYSIITGGDEIYKLIFIIFSILFSYNLVSLFFISRKQKKFFSNKKR